MLQTATDYRLYLPDGSYRVLGPDSNADRFIAHLTRITSDVSWDSSESKIAQGHGSIIGSAWRGSRVVVADLLIATNDPEERAHRLEWLMQLNGVLSSGQSCRLTWKEATGFTKQIEGLRPVAYLSPDTDGPAKNVQLQLRTGDPFIRSAEIYERVSDGVSPWTLNVFNPGNAPAFPRIEIEGLVSSFQVTDLVSGSSLIYNETVPDNSSIIIDCDPRKRTVKTNLGANAYGNFDFSSSKFFELPPYAADHEIEISLGPGFSDGLAKIRWQACWE